MGFVFAPRLRASLEELLPDLVRTCRGHGAFAEMKIKALRFPGQVTVGQELACLCFLVFGEPLVVEVIDLVRVVVSPEGH